MILGDAYIFVHHTHFTYTNTKIHNEDYFVECEWVACGLGEGHAGDT
jgi:hypothetical protein